MAYFNQVVLGFRCVPFSVHALSNQNRAVRCRMRKPRKLKVIFYYACMIGLNENLAYFPEGKARDKIGDMGLNKNLLNSLPNECIKQAYMHGFGFKTITF